MKFVHCKKCQDIVKLWEEGRYCRCGSCGGRYVDRINAVFWGDGAVPLGLDNNSFVQALRSVAGHRTILGSIGYNSFVIQEPCSTFVRIKEEK